MLIREKDRISILNIAKNSFSKPYKIWAFGSRVNGKAHDLSDLDIVVIGDNGEKILIDQFLDFKNRLRDSNIPIIVQVIDWNRVPQSFHQNILKNYEVL